MRRATKFISRGLCLGIVALFSTMKASVAADFLNPTMFLSAIETGALPDIGGRIPTVPVIVQPTDRLGLYGGTWRMAMRRDRDHALFIRTMGYENLLRWNPDWTGYLSNVAQSYKVNADATEYIFSLREGMRWSDGAPFGVHDILFWFEHIIPNRELTERADLWRFSGGRELRVEKRSPNSIAFIFDQPHKLFPEFLAGPDGVEPISYPAHYLKKFLPAFNSKIHEEAQAAGYADWPAQFKAKFGKIGTIDDKSRWLNKDLPTLNAWVFDNRYTVDEPVSAVRNPYYWKVDDGGRQLPYIDRLEFAVVNSKAEAADLARAGAIDMQLRAMAPLAGEIAKNPDKWPELRTFKAVTTDMNTAVALFNLNHADPVLRDIFQNKNFRIAMSHAINRKDIIGNTTGGQTTLGTPYQAAPRPESPFYNEKLASQYLDFEPKKSTALLDQIGLHVGDDGIRRRPDGKPLSFFIDAATDFKSNVAKKIAQDWRKVGIDVTARKLDRNAMYAERQLNAHDVTLMGGDGGLDVVQAPLFYFPFSYESFQAVNWARWFVDPSDPKAEEPIEPVKKQMALYKKLLDSRGNDARIKLMGQVLDIAASEFYVMGISLPPDWHGLYRKGFENVPMFMPSSWTYPTPAPTNPAQYFFSE